MATPMDVNFQKPKESTLDYDMIDPNMYRQLIGSLMFLTNTRPDICFAMNTLSQFVSDEALILVLYVDDLFLIENEKCIIWCKKKLASEFEMKDLGLMHYFLGL